MRVKNKFEFLLKEMLSLLGLPELIVETDIFSGLEINISSRRDNKRKP